MSITNLNLWDRIPANQLMQYFPQIDPAWLPDRAVFQNEVMASGFSLAGFAFLLTAFRVIGSLASFLLSILLIRRYPHALMAVLFACLLSVMGAQSRLDLLSIHPAQQRDDPPIGKVRCDKPLRQFPVHRWNRRGHGQTALLAQGCQPGQFGGGSFAVIDCMDAQNKAAGKITWVIRLDRVRVRHIHAVDRIFMVLNETQARLIQAIMGQLWLPLPSIGTAGCAWKARDKVSWMA